MDEVAHPLIDLFSKALMTLSSHNNFPSIWMFQILHKGKHLIPMTFLVILFLVSFNDNIISKKDTLLQLVTLKIVPFKVKSIQKGAKVIRSYTLKIVVAPL